MILVIDCGSGSDSTLEALSMFNPDGQIEALPSIYQEATVFESLRFRVLLRLPQNDYVQSQRGIVKMCKVRTQRESSKDIVTRPAL